MGNAWDNPETTGVAVKPYETAQDMDLAGQPMIKDASGAVGTRMNFLQFMTAMKAAGSGGSSGGGGSIPPIIDSSNMVPGAPPLMQYSGGGGGGGGKSGGGGADIGKLVKLAGLIGGG